MENNMPKTFLKQFWMSFCDPEAPKGNQFLGVIIVEGVDLRDAIFRTHALNINPGGEIEGIELEKDVIKPEHIDQLYTKKQLIEFGYLN